ncbi:ladderlectin-like [Lampris incognitus]|uniref:ladderlectin-like n=1 Tax=Lampris incognitus TaxID=2546036 RepID=UPI0024B4CA09|nr:ladderlectin-like [Lampris incognitus]
MLTISLLVCVVVALSGATEAQKETSMEQALPKNEVIPAPAEEIPEEVMTESKTSLEEEEKALKREMAEEEAAGAELVGTGVESRSYCPPGWSGFGSRCFIYINSPRSWPQAEQYCVHFGATLASVHSSNEYYFIQEVVRRRTGEFPRTWIGGIDAVQENLWFWSDGSRFDYQNWLRGEPNNSAGGEHCIEMNFGDPKQWNDSICGGQRGFVCAKTLNDCFCSTSTES